MDSKVKNTKELIHQATGTEIAFCYGDKALRKYYAEQTGMEEYLEHLGTTFILTRDKDFRLIIGVKKSLDIYSLKSTVVHELSHAVTEIMNYFGFDCDEFRSYTLQWLYVEIIPFLDSLINKNLKVEETK